MTVHFTTGEVLAATKGKLISQGLTLSFEGVSTDTRTLKSGSLFVALSGERFDGHTFIPAAISRGATGLVVSSMPIEALPGITIFLVPDTRIAFEDLAHFHRCRFELPVIAITGSNGKTSTKDMIAAVLSTKLNVLKTEANFNNEIGLSQTLLKIDIAHQAVVVEMGMRGRGEIAELAAIAMPTVGVVTNVGETHLERLGSIENIATAKAELVEALDEHSVAFLNGDDVHVRTMREKTAARTVSFGMNAECTVRAANLKLSPTGVAFDCLVEGKTFPIALPIQGVHNAYNALAAIAVGLELGLEPREIAQGLANYEPGKMRLDIKRYGDITVIDDTYNASPLSMAAAIEVLAAVATGRKTAAIGDMLELGAASGEAHAKVGRHLATVGTEMVLTIGEHAKVAGEAARQQGVPVVIDCADHAAAIVELRQRLLPGDTLLLKGSRGMAMEKLLNVFTSLPEV